jgi:hypothetical protein
MLADSAVCWCEYHKESCSADAYSEDHGSRLAL